MNEITFLNNIAFILQIFELLNLLSPFWLIILYIFLLLFLVYLFREINS